MHLTKQMMVDAADVEELVKLRDEIETDVEMQDIVNKTIQATMLCTMAIPLETALYALFLHGYSLGRIVAEVNQLEELKER